MSCHGNNATPPGPAFAPGAELIDPVAAAIAVGQLWAPEGQSLSEQSGLLAGRDRRRGVEFIRRTVPGFDAPFFQAGLAGYSDAAMRLVAREQGAPYCVTEALLDRMLLGGGHGFDKADLSLIEENVPCGDADHPISGQIIGSEPDEMAAAAIKMIEQGRRPAAHYRGLAYARTAMPDPGTDPRMRNWYVESGPGSSPDKAPVGPQPNGRSFETIDVNLACPVKKIRNKGRGGHWLSDPIGAIEILRAVRAAVPGEIPCSVKLRRGSDDSPEAELNFERIFAAAYDLGYCWATVHGRTVEQKYMGPSRWTFLRDLVSRHPDKVIFGSGDVWGVFDIFRMIAYTGVHGVSVARGCIGNPWIFRQARRRMAGLPAAGPTIPEQKAVMRRHFDLSVALNGERAAARMMRKFGIRFGSHHPRAQEVRQRMIGVNTVNNWQAVLAEFYADEEPTQSADAVNVARAAR